MGAKYVITLPQLVGALANDVANGTGEAGSMLRDLADQATPLPGFKEVAADIALQQFPAIYAAAMAKLHEKTSLVELPAEKP